MASASWQGAAVAVAVVHLAVVLFLLGGGFLVRRHRRLLPLHLAVVVAVVAVAVVQAQCPLTELELWLRERGGLEVYRGGFIAHYLVRPVYAPGMTSPVEILVNAFAVVVNLVAYARLLAEGSLGWQRPRERRSSRHPARQLLRR